MTSLPVQPREVKFHEIQVGDMIEYTNYNPLASSGGFTPAIPRIQKLLVLSNHLNVWRTLQVGTNVFVYLSHFDIDHNRDPVILLSRAEVM